MQHFTPMEAAQAITQGCNGDPFSILGMHADGPDGSMVVRVYFPAAEHIEVIDKKRDRVVAELSKLLPEGFFAGVIKQCKQRFPYKLRVILEDRELLLEDPYRFGTILDEETEMKLVDGNHWRSYETLGAHLTELEDVAGVSFAVWAPNASRVSVVGDFNNWDGRRHVMRLRHRCSVWEIFVPNLTEGDRYLFELKDRKGNLLPLKADPYAFATERPPHKASVVGRIDPFKWSDQTWMESRASRMAIDAPISVYEVHLGSWRRVAKQDNRFLSYLELADNLVPYVKRMGFTHVELMPNHEYPFYGSWGYQPVSLYAPTSRYGTPEEFKQLVERFHQAGIGVILDWVPGHFPADSHGLAQFDGTHLYEHEDPRQGVHPDWGTLLYNYRRTEVANFVIGNAMFWLDQYHIDGLRVDAVASMLYLDYSREQGEWIPNAQGGNANLESISLIRQMNALVKREFEGVMTIAEESTAWPGVTTDPEQEGLGFSYKWNMGWMHDTLSYMSLDPLHRNYHHHRMTFGMVYAYDERFMLSLSHDEVVHLKCSLYGKMSGDAWHRFANLRAYYAFMWTQPGKKLIFMGGEFAQKGEWNHLASLDWHLLTEPAHRSIQELVCDLNQLYRTQPALHQTDSEPTGFQWVKVDEQAESYYAYLRLPLTTAPLLLVICNFTPVPRYDYRFGVPKAGFYKEILNTDSLKYGGKGMLNHGGVVSKEIAEGNQPFSVQVTLPPLATVILEVDP